MLPLGTVAPDFRLPDVSGKSVVLADFGSAPEGNQGKTGSRGRSTLPRDGGCALDKGGGRGRVAACR